VKPRLVEPQCPFSKQPEAGYDGKHPVLQDPLRNVGRGR
jgi:hypothetical protein